MDYLTISPLQTGWAFTLEKWIKTTCSTEGLQSGGCNLETIRNTRELFTQKDVPWIIRKLWEYKRVSLVMVLSPMVIPLLLATPVIEICLTEQKNICPWTTVGWEEAERSKKAQKKDPWFLFFGVLSHLTSSQRLSLAWICSEESDTSVNSLSSNA